MIANFLNHRSNLPIVCHPVDFDRDKVLRDAFSSARSFSKLPDRSRFRCTFNMSRGLPGLKSRSLDDLLEYFGYKPREEDAKHNAVEDCELTAKVYMAILDKQEETKPSLGFSE